MDTEGLDPQKLHGAPPLMPWQKFAEWIGMGDEPIVVRTWVERNYLPSQKVGKRTMVNVALLTQQRRLDQSRHTGRRVEVADIGLERPD